MTAKIFVVTSDREEPTQVGGTWLSIDDASGDIDGGDFWNEMRELFPNGTTLKEIRIVPGNPEPVVWDGDDE